MKRKLLVSAVIAASVTVAGAAAIALPQGTDGAKNRIILAEGQTLLPSETLQDWVTYSDHVAVVTLSSVKELPASEESAKAGEGFIPRVTSYKVTDILWSRDGARPAPSEISLDLDGYSFKGDQKTPIRVPGQPLLEKVGAVYVMPIVYLEKTEVVSVPGWSNLSPDAIVPFGGNEVGRGDRLAAGEESRSEAVAATWGQDRQALTGSISQQDPDPAAVPFMAEPPDVRYNHAAAAARLKESKG